MRGGHLTVRSGQVCETAALRRMQRVRQIALDPAGNAAKAGPMGRLPKNPIPRFQGPKPLRFHQN